MNNKVRSIFQTNDNSIYKTKKFVIVFYIIGFLGLIFPYTSLFFKAITPLALIINYIIVLLYHKGKFNKKSFLIFLLIFISGFIIEVIGTQTGKIFGEYYYGNALGIKLFNVPIIIGLNWLFLCYVTNSIFEKISINTVFKIIGVSILMLLYDLILEQVASFLDYWYWTNNNIPIQNYIAWFGISLIFNSIIQLMRISTKNPMSNLLFGVQISFFLFIFIYINYL